MTYWFWFFLISLSVCYLLLNISVLADPLFSDKDYLLKLILFLGLLFNMYLQAKRIKQAWAKTYDLYRFKKQLLTDALFLILLSVFCLRFATARSQIAFIAAYLFYLAFLFLVNTQKGYREPEL